MDVQPLVEELERIQGGRKGSDDSREFESPVRHSRSAVQPPVPKVTVLHLVVKAVASALIEVNPPRESSVERGEQKNRACEALSAREIRENGSVATRVACVCAPGPTAASARDTQMTRIGPLEGGRDSGEPRVSGVVIIEGAERKSAATVAAEVFAAGDPYKSGVLTDREENVESLARSLKGVDLLPVSLREPPHEVPLLHPGSLSGLAGMYPEDSAGTRNSGTRGGVFSAGEAATPWYGRERRADCLVEVKPFFPPPALLQKTFNLAGASQDTLLSKVYGDTCLSNLPRALDGLGGGVSVTAVRETRGGRTRAPVKVTVGCLSALVDEREGKGSSSGALLEIGVVGDAVTGERITGRFARALKRCLLGFARNDR